LIVIIYRSSAPVEDELDTEKICSWCPHYNTEPTVEKVFKNYASCITEGQIIFEGINFNIEGLKINIKGGSNTAII